MTQRATEHKIILVVRRTRLDDLITRFNTLAQAQFYIEHLGADFSDYLLEDQYYKQAVEQAHNQLKKLGRVHVVDRTFLPNFIFAPQDTIVVLGQDGLVVNTLKYLNGQAVIGVNPEPQRYDGVLLPFHLSDLKTIVIDIFHQRRSLQTVTMAKATLNNGQSLYGVNDLFIGPKSHTSARYHLQIGKKMEQQISSGIIVSTGLGSTGWFKSLVLGARSVARAWEKISRKKRSASSEEEDSRFPWNADYLYFTVREPFPSAVSTAQLTFGKITAGQPMQVISQMPENGVIFSDGIETDFLEFNAGTQAIVGVADKKGYLVI